MLFKKDDFRNFTSSGIYSELSSLGDLLVVLLNVLSSYLREQDITKLEPLELAVNKANPRCVIKIEDFLKNAEAVLLKAEKEAEEKKAKEEEEKRRQQELNAWRTASRNNTSTGYQVYLNKYPLGEYVQEARKMIAECIEAEEEAKRLAAIKAEEEAWANACSYNTADSFSLFLRKYPNSKYKETATKRFEACKEAEEWKQAKASKTITRLDGFIKNYPNSIHVTEARTIISELKEDNAWKTAQNIDTIESYKSYLSQYPNGQYVFVAENNIETLKKFKFPWIAVGLIAIAIAAYIALVHNLAPIDFDFTPSQLERRESAQTRPKPTGEFENISQIANELDVKLKGLELQKKRGKLLDVNELNKAKSLLSRLYGKSLMYDSFKQRIENL